MEYLSGESEKQSYAKETNDDLEMENLSDNPTEEKQSSIREDLSK